MEELILVTGCTLVDAWAAAAFVGRTEIAEISLSVSRPQDRGDIMFECRSTQGDVAQHYSCFDSARFLVPFTHCTPTFSIFASEE
jgi:hypothetical protein